MRLHSRKNIVELVDEMVSLTEAKKSKEFPWVKTTQGEHAAAISGSTVIHEDPSYVVRRVDDHPAMRVLGSKTKWCTVPLTVHPESGQTGMSMFHGYKKQGDMYHVHDKETNERFLIHWPTNQQMREDDTHAEDSDLMKYHEGISKAFVEHYERQGEEIDPRSAFAPRHMVDGLVKSSWGRDRTDAASHPAITSEQSESLYRRALKDLDDPKADAYSNPIDQVNIIRGVLRNRVTPASVFEDALHNKHIHNPQNYRGMFAGMRKEVDEHVPNQFFYDMSQNPSTPGAVLDQMYGLTGSGMTTPVRNDLLSNPSLPTKTAHRAAEDSIKMIEAEPSMSMSSSQAGNRNNDGIRGLSQLVGNRNLDGDILHRIITHPKIHDDYAYEFPIEEALFNKNLKSDTKAHLLRIASGEHPASDSDHGEELRSQFLERIEAAPNVTPADVEYLYHHGQKGPLFGLSDKHFDGKFVQSQHVPSSVLEDILSRNFALQESGKDPAHLAIRTALAHKNLSPDALHNYVTDNIEQMDLDSMAAVPRNPNVHPKTLTAAFEETMGSASGHYVHFNILGSKKADSALIDRISRHYFSERYNPEEDHQNGNVKRLMTALAAGKAEGSTIEHAWKTLKENPPVVKYGNEKDQPLWMSDFIHKIAANRNLSEQGYTDIHNYAKESQRQARENQDFNLDYNINQTFLSLAGNPKAPDHILQDLLGDHHHETVREMAQSTLKQRK